MLNQVEMKNRTEALRSARLAEAEDAYEPRRASIEEAYAGTGQDTGRRQQLAQAWEESCQSVGLYYDPETGRMEVE